MINNRSGGKMIISFSASMMQTTQAQTHKFSLIQAFYRSFYQSFHLPCFSVNGIVYAMSTNDCIRIIWKTTYGETDYFVKKM